MDQNNRGDIRINGSGSAGGGTYDNVIIRGSGKITGSVKCEVFNISGSGDVAGNLEAIDGRISGSGTVEGDVKADRFKISGSGKIKGDLKAKEFSISGSGTVQKNVDAQIVHIEGSGKIGMNCSAEKFTADGGCDIGGLLSADEVTIRIFGLSNKIREIGGGKISVSLGMPHGLGVLRTIVSLGIFNPVLEVDTIEGDDIVLENTAARIVRGKSVVIGSGCDIGTVEYTEFYQKNIDAKVSAETKL
jgi:cytoskeletal protein CcmA (bactofilin family)